MDFQKIEKYIVRWLANYIDNTSLNGFVVGVSGGIDSAVTSTLCAKTGLPTTVLNMPILQKSNQYLRSDEHIKWLKDRYENISSEEIDLSPVFNSYSQYLPSGIQDYLTMANLRSRIRMATLYAFASSEKKIVVGTGNKVEDFGVGFFTKYGDGGVDISPIADLMKTEVFKLATHMDIVGSIQNAAPTDGLWEDDRSDEDQLGATYEELEWAMKFTSEEVSQSIDERQSEVLKIYNDLHFANLHKIDSIPICKIPLELK
jgi:NAD+ synthase